MHLSSMEVFYMSWLLCADTSIIQISTHNPSVTPVLQGVLRVVLNYAGIVTGVTAHAKGKSWRWSKHKVQKQVKMLVYL